MIIHFKRLGKYQHILRRRLRHRMIASFGSGCANWRPCAVGSAIVGYMCCSTARGSCSTTRSCGGSMPRNGYGFNAARILKPIGVPKSYFPTRIGRLVRQEPQGEQWLNRRLAGSAQTTMSLGFNPKARRMRSIFSLDSAFWAALLSPERIKISTSSTKPVPRTESSVIAMGDRPSLLGSSVSMTNDCEVDAESVEQPTVFRVRLAFDRVPASAHYASRPSGHRIAHQRLLKHSPLGVFGTNARANSTWAEPVSWLTARRKASGLATRAQRNWPVPSHRIVVVFMMSVLALNEDRRCRAGAQAHRVIRRERENRNRESGLGNAANRAIGMDNHTHLLCEPGLIWPGRLSVGAEGWPLIWRPPGLWHRTDTAPILSDCPSSDHLAQFGSWISGVSASSLG
jgi:hypothetical protein